jgi:thiamine-phosphate pyrophosphorylase
MPLNRQKPIIYLITSGRTTPRTLPATDEFRSILYLIEAAVAARIDLIQIREKELTDRVLFDLCLAAKRLTKNTATRLLVNDRADIACAGDADGVHLTTRSLQPAVVRATFGEELLIGVSTHSVGEIEKARTGGADFAVFGPVFQTESKRKYGAPVGTEQLRVATTEARGLPVLALGGISLDNAAECFSAGASGVAAINLLSVPKSLSKTAEELRAIFNRKRY